MNKSVGVYSEFFVTFAVNNDTRTCTEFVVTQDITIRELITNFSLQGHLK